MFRFLPLLLLSLAILPSASPAPQARAQGLPSDSSYVPGEVILSLDRGASAASLGIDSSLVRQTTPDGRHVTVAVPAGREVEMIERFGDRPGIAAAELNVLKQPAFVPNDEKYNLQWDMRMIGAEAAWDLTRGAGVTIAVLDTGVAFEDYKDFGRSPQLSHTRFVSPYDATDNNAHPNDENGHGTHVTGTIAQDFDDGVGAAGLAPEAAIMPVKVCEPYGCPADDMARGIDWAVDHGADVINMSLGGATITRTERDALARAEAQGVVVVAAAGNGGGDFVGDNRLVYPGAVETVLSVGSVDPNAVRAPYSNYGNGEGDNILIVAPGGNLHTDKNDDGQPDGILQNTYLHACGGGTVDYTAFTDCMYHGTSMATPHVAASAALLLSLFPSLTPLQVRTVLACTAEDVGPLGDDIEYGAGLLRIDYALEDPDFDGVPGCVEEPAQVLVGVTGGQVAPGQTIVAAIDMSVAGGEISAYDLAVSFNEDLVTATACKALNGGACTIYPDYVAFAVGEPGLPAGATPSTKPLSGDFQLGDITFVGGTDTTLGSYLHLTAYATVYYDHNPDPEVTTEDGFIWVQEVPETVSGDSNCDGEVSPADVVLTLASVGAIGGGFCDSYADVNCSGAVEHLDLLATLTFLAGLEPTLPAGCPAIGSAAA